MLSETDLLQKQENEAGFATGIADGAMLQLPTARFPPAATTSLLLFVDILTTDLATETKELDILLPAPAIVSSVSARVSVCFRSQESLIQRLSPFRVWSLNPNLRV